MKNNKNEQHEHTTGMHKEVEKYEIFLFWSLRCIADECYAEQNVGSTTDYWVFRKLLKRGIFCWFFKYLLCSTLLHLPPLRFDCVGGCWDWTQYCVRLCETVLGSIPRILRMKTFCTHHERWIKHKKKGKINMEDNQWMNPGWTQKIDKFTSWNC